MQRFLELRVVGAATRVVFAYLLVSAVTVLGNRWRGSPSGAPDRRELDDTRRKKLSLGRVVSTAVTEWRVGADVVRTDSPRLGAAPQTYESERPEPISGDEVNVNLSEESGNSTIHTLMKNQSVTTDQTSLPGDCCTVG